MEMPLETLLTKDAFEHLTAKDRETLAQLLARLDAAEKVCVMIDRSLSPAQRAEAMRARQERTGGGYSIPRSAPQIHWWDVRAAVNAWKALVQSSTNRAATKA